jgi:hypothetical protein
MIVAAASWTSNLMIESGFRADSPYHAQTAPALCRRTTSAPV